MSIISEIATVFSVDKAFSLAAKGKDASALGICNKVFGNFVSGRIKTSNSSLEASLLRAFLMMEQGDTKAVRESIGQYLRQRDKGGDFNKAERAYMERYAVSVLWIARGRAEQSCLIRIRNGLSKDMGVVRPTTMSRFHSPDE